MKGSNRPWRGSSGGVQGNGHELTRKLKGSEGRSLVGGQTGGKRSNIKRLGRVEMLQYTSQSLGHRGEGAFSGNKKERAPARELIRECRLSQKNTGE